MDPETEARVAALEAAIIAIGVALHEGSTSSVLQSADAPQMLGSGGRLAALEGKGAERFKSLFEAIRNAADGRPGVSQHFSP